MTLLQQCDYAFKPFFCIIALCLYRCSLWLLHLDNETLTFLVFFLVTEALLRCRGRKAIKLSRAQSCYLELEPIVYPGLPRYVAHFFAPSPFCSFEQTKNAQ